MSASAVVVVYRVRHEPSLGRNPHFTWPWDYGYVDPEGANSGPVFGRIPDVRRAIRARFGRAVRLVELWRAADPVELVAGAGVVDRRWLLEKCLADVGSPVPDWRGDRAHLRPERRAA